MPVQLPDITSRIRIRTDDLDKAASHADRSTRNIGASFDRLGANLRRWGAGLTAAVSLPILAIGTAAVKAASDFGETESKANTVFKGMEADLERVKKASIETWGLSKQSALDMLSTFGAIGQGMGMTRDASFRLAESVTNLTADFASFHNLPFEQVSEKIRGALTGEYEGLKALGIVLDDASVKKRALMDTGKSHADQLTQEELVNARLALIYEKAGVAVGDYARTKDSAANRSRAVKERLEELSITLGERLLPLFERALNVITPVLDRFSKMDTGTQNLVIGVGALAVALGPVITALGVLASHPVIAALGLLAAGFAYAYTQSDTFRQGVDLLVDAVQVGLATAVRTGLIVLQQLSNIVLIGAESFLTFQAVIAGWNTEAGRALRNVREDISATRGHINDEISRVIPQLDIFINAHTQQALEGIANVRAQAEALERRGYTVRIDSKHGIIANGHTERQHGGPVSPRRLYRVGERGPEWFVPWARGFVVNMRQAAQAAAAMRGNLTANIVTSPARRSEQAQRGGFHVHGDLVVNNPLPSPVEDTIPDVVRKLNYFGGGM